MSALPELTIAKVIEACGKIDGRVKLQKIVYLLSAMGYQLPYRDFHVRHYGPFSPRLAAALDFLVSVGVVTEHPVPVGEESQRYDYETSPRYSDSLAEYVHVPVPEGRPALEAVGAQLARCDRPTLEITATMHYLHDQEGRSDDALTRELAALKGHLPDFEAKAREATQLLQELGLSIN